MKVAKKLSTAYVEDGWDGSEEDRDDAVLVCSVTARDSGAVVEEMDVDVDTEVDGVRRLLSKVTALPLPLPSGPQITRRIGNSFAQLLTSNAVLIAVGLAGNGGGSGWTDWPGAAEGRREVPARRGDGDDIACAAGGETTSTGRPVDDGN